MALVTVTPTPVAVVSSLPEMFVQPSSPRMDFVSNDLLVDGGGFPAFTLVKSASYAAVLGFFDLGKQIDEKLSGELGGSITDFWRTEI